MRSFLTKLIIKYRVVVFKKDSLEKLGSFYVNRLHVAMFTILIFTISLFVCSLLLFFSPLGSKFFDYSKKKEISNLYLHVDSLENLLNLHFDYTENLKLIFNELDTSKNTAHKNNAFSLNSLQSRITKQDSSLINYIEKLDEVSIIKYNKDILNRLSVCVPTKGIVTSSFNIKEGHLGVDIAAKENADVVSILNGVVLFDGHSDDFGNFIIIGHENNFLSIYLHNSILLKNKGDLVKSGEKIALVGSSGSLSTAPHLHFEIWNGINPIDPEKYLQFN